MKAQNKVSYTIAERTKYLRLRLKLTQAKLAKKSGVSQSVIADLESGTHDPTLSTLEKVAAGLEIHVALFFSSEDLLVFDLKKLEKNYKTIGSLNETISHALLKITHYAKKIGYIS